jgi:hypothetical protein
MNWPTPFDFDNQANVRDARIRWRVTGDPHLAELPMTHVLPHWGTYTTMGLPQLNYLLFSGLDQQLRCFRRYP